MTPLGLEQDPGPLFDIWETPEPQIKKKTQQASKGPGLTGSAESQKMPVQSHSEAWHVSRWEPLGRGRSLQVQDPLSFDKAMGIPFLSTKHLSSLLLLG